MATTALPPLPAAPEHAVRRRRPGRDGVRAQFVRFVLVGGTATAVQAALFLAFLGTGPLLANLVSTLVATVLANELHRQATFRAGQRAGWLAVQWSGSGMAAAGLTATTLTLGWLEALSGGADGTVQLVAVLAVNALVGIGRFTGLRWLLVTRGAMVPGPVRSEDQGRMGGFPDVRGHGPTAGFSA